MKNNKGFTLIELMIAIAIIGILALVLIPRVAGLKDQAKLAGIDTNMRVAQGIIEGMITDYDATKIADVEGDIADRLKASTPPSEKDIKNPMTQSAGVVVYNATAPAPDNGNVAFTYVDSDSTDGSSTLPADIADNPNMKGVISFSAYTDGAEVLVRLVPYDDRGNAMTAKIKTVQR